MTRAVIPDLESANIVYYGVWAIVGGSSDDLLNNTTHNVVSFAYGEPEKVNTPLAAPIFLTPNSYVDGNLAWGATDVQADNAQITWGDVTDPYYATRTSFDDYAHELQIVKYTDNQDYLALLETAPIINIPAGCYSYSPVLEYNTAYAVRVRGITEESKGEWGYLVFSTVENSPYGVDKDGGEDVTITQTSIVLPDPVTVTENTISCEPDTLTVTVPAPTEYTLAPPEAGSSSTPIYIWIIIAVAAVFCVAVIVLIVRTRRTA